MIFRLLFVCLFCFHVLHADAIHADKGIVEKEYSAIWLTWLHDPTSTMTISWLAPALKEAASTSLAFHKKGEASPWKEMEVELSSLPEDVEAAMGSTELTNLESNTEYEFRIGAHGEVFGLKTAPSDILKPLSFVIGGDVMPGDPALFEDTCKKAAAYQPSFVVFGGDLAYSAPDKKSKKEDFPRWTKWFQIIFETLRIDNQLIPIVTAIGNHEVKGGFGQTREEAPFFYTFFRKPYLDGYMACRFNNYLSLYLLDSGHTNSISGAQAEWLENQLKRDRKSLHRIAIYHVPAYPSVRYFKNETSSKIRKHWAPLFDKYRLNMAFENHDHAYKRTFPLRGGEIDPRGVVYIGDGSWGVHPRVPRKASSTDFLAKTESARQFALVTISEEERLVTIISSEGKSVDKVVQLVEDETQK